MKIRQIGILIIAATVIVSCNKVPDQTKELAQQTMVVDLSGRLDTILTYAGRDTSQPALVTILTYNDRNKLVKVNTIDRNNGLQHPTGEYQYDGGRLVRYSTLYGPEPGIYTFSESSKANVISWWSVYPHTLKRRQIILRTASGRDSIELIRQFNSAQDSLTVSKQVVTSWNEFGLATKTKITWYSGKDSMVYERAYRYDNNQFATLITEKQLPSGNAYSIYEAQPLPQVERFTPMKALAQFPVTEPMRYLKSQEIRYLAGVPSQKTVDEVIGLTGDMVTSFQRTKTDLQDNKRKPEVYLVRYLSHK